MEIKDKKNFKGIIFFILILLIIFQTIKVVNYDNSSSTQNNKVSKKKETSEEIKKVEEKESIPLKNEIYSKIINDQEYQKEFLKVLENNQIKTCTVTDEFQCNYSSDNSESSDKKKVKVKFYSERKDDGLIELDEVEIIINIKKSYDDEWEEEKYKYNFIQKETYEYDAIGEEWEREYVYMNDKSKKITKLIKIYDEILLIPR